MRFRVIGRAREMVTCASKYQEPGAGLGFTATSASFDLGVPARLSRAGIRHCAGEGNSTLGTAIFGCGPLEKCGHIVAKNQFSSADCSGSGIDVFGSRVEQRTVVQCICKRAFAGDAAPTGTSSQFRGGGI